MNIHISFITVFPELHEQWLASSLLKRAQQAGIITTSTIRLADLVAPKERIDTPTCGPGPGMVLRAEVVSAAIEQARSEHGDGFVVFFSPSGTLLTQRVAEQMVERIVGDVGGSSSQLQSASYHLIMVCARYEGVDCRVEQAYADAVISIGDYVLMGGDIPAQIFCEVLLRLFPGVLGNSYSFMADSFQGPLLDYPAYGQPVEWHDMKVPEVLLSGDHEKINTWREAIALKETLLKRFEWLRTSQLDMPLRKKIRKALPQHYVILMHDQVFVGKRDQIKEGSTSVTTIDVHDIARSSATYGIHKFFIVTSLRDQQRLLQVFFQFWHTAEGKSYNENRYDAMRHVVVVSSIEEAEAIIAEENEGKAPLRVATSAKQFEGVTTIDYDEQGEVWQHDRPVALIFGTGQGLTGAFLQSCNYLLVPLRGFGEYNHLSVRGAVAIILDRWLAWRGPK